MIPSNTTRQSLPAEHEQVRFIVVGHRTWLSGSYQNNRFRSRWATYPTSEVRSWSKLDENSLRARVAPDPRYWSERRMRESP